MISEGGGSRVVGRKGEIGSGGRGGLVAGLGIACGVVAWSRVGWLGRVGGDKDGGGRAVARLEVILEVLELYGVESSEERLTRSPDGRVVFWRVSFDCG